MTAEAIVEQEHPRSEISGGRRDPCHTTHFNIKAVSSWNGQYPVLRKVGPVTYAAVDKPTQAAAITTISTLCSRDHVLLANSTYTQYEGMRYFQTSALHAYHYVPAPRFYNCALLEIIINGHSKPVAIRQTSRNTHMHPLPYPMVAGYHLK